MTWILSYYLTFTSQNRKLDGIGLRYQTVTLSYANATTLRGYTSFATPVLCAVANIEDQAGTPTTQVNNIVTDIGYAGTAGGVEVYANGSNFVSDHVLKVNEIAIVQN